MGNVNREPRSQADVQHRLELTLGINIKWHYLELALILTIYNQTFFPFNSIFKDLKVII